MESIKDDKVNSEKVKYIIPKKKCAKPFKENLSSQTSHLVPMKNHQNCFKGNCPKWPKVRNWDSHGKILSQHKVYQSSSKLYSF